jgi:hypothetical protein
VTGLPSADEMLLQANAKLGEAYAALGDAADWLRSDWAPVGSALTSDQARRRAAMRQAITAAKNAINGGRS